MLYSGKYHNTSVKCLSPNKCTKDLRVLVTVEVSTVLCSLFYGQNLHLILLLQSRCASCYEDTRMYSFLCQPFHSIENLCHHVGTNAILANFHHSFYYLDIQTHFFFAFCVYLKCLLSDAKELIFIQLRPHFILFSLFFVCFRIR